MGVGHLYPLGYSPILAAGQKADNLLVVKQKPFSSDYIKIHFKIYDSLKFLLLEFRDDIRPITLVNYRQGFVPFIRIFIRFVKLSTFVKLCQLVKRKKPPSQVVPSDE